MRPRRTAATERGGTRDPTHRAPPRRIPVKERKARITAGGKTGPRPRDGLEQLRAATPDHGDGEGVQPVARDHAGPRDGRGARPATRGHTGPRRDPGPPTAATPDRGI